MDIQKIISTVKESEVRQAKIQTEKMEVGLTVGTPPMPMNMLTYVV